MIILDFTVFYANFTTKVKVQTRSEFETTIPKSTVRISVKQKKMPDFISDATGNIVSAIF